MRVASIRSTFTTVIFMMYTSLTSSGFDRCHKLPSNGDAAHHAVRREAEPTVHGGKGDDTSPPDTALLPYLAVGLHNDGDKT